LPIHEIEELTTSNQMEEELFLGLRKKVGISKIQFAEKFGKSFQEIYGSTSEQLIQKGWLASQGDRVFLTKAGMFIGNEVFEAFLLDAEK